MKVGHGEITHKAGDSVKAHYTGTLLDGTKFDSSRDRGSPFDFTLGRQQVIPCWDKAFAAMRVGERAMLTCTAEYAYGQQGSPPKIPGGATLKFDVEFVSVQSGSAGSEEAVTIDLSESATDRASEL
jgi:FKBP-type peptidyl-prolyl cis-trans isomerase